MGMLLLSSGCSGDGMVEVRGTVKLDGKPLVDGQIDFLPASDDGPTASAIIKNGAYATRVMPGEKTVKIEGYEKIGQHKYDPGNPDSPMVDDFKPIVPAKYNERTELECAVTEETIEQNFELSSK